MHSLIYYHHTSKSKKSKLEEDFAISDYTAMLLVMSMAFRNYSGSVSSERKETIF